MLVVRAPFDYGEFAVGAILIERRPWWHLFDRYAYTVYYADCVHTSTGRAVSLDKSISIGRVFARAHSEHHLRLLKKDK